MPTTVDASALAAILFVEPDADTVADRIRGHDLIAPHLLDFELASIAVKHVRKFGLSLDDALAALRDARRFNVEGCTVDATEVAALAVHTGLSAYDASYLWLSRTRDAPLVTLDAALARAADQI